MKLIFGLLAMAPLLFDKTESVSYGRFISIEQAPYFVSLNYVDEYDDNHFFCGGSIISEYWIITAAHCVDEPFGQIVAGQSVRYKSKRLLAHRFEKVFVHGGYVMDNDVLNDIALIKLNNPIEFNERRQPIKIRKTPPRENETLIIMGFGDQGDAKGASPVLKQSEVTVVNDTLCSDDKLDGLLDVTFCAGDGTTDVCRGDSGGPAVIDGQLAGLVSYGPKCTMVREEGAGPYPGKYTRVDAFYGWIVNVTGIAL